jgi:hypothetical protein
MSNSSKSHPENKIKADLKSLIQSAEEKYAEKLWGILLSADADGNKQISTTEWINNIDQIRKKHPQELSSKAILLLNSYKQMEAAQAPQKELVITKEDFAKLGATILFSEEIIKTTLQEYSIFIQDLPIDKIQKEQLIGEFENIFKKIDSNGDIKITFGELMMNNNFSLEVTSPPIPQLKSSPTPSTPGI